MKKQRGFIISILLFGIALMAVVMVAISYGGRGAEEGQRIAEYQAVADLVLDQSLQIAVAVPNFQKLFNPGQVPAETANLNFSTTQPHGLFAPDYGLSEIKSIQPHYYRDGSGYAANNRYTPTANTDEYAAGSWRMNNNVTFPGDDAVLVIIVPDIRAELCREINRIVWREQFATPPRLSNAADMEDWAGPATPAAADQPDAVTVVDPAFDVFREGCALSRDDRRFYLRQIADLPDPP